MSDYSTHSVDDAATSALHDTYPDPPAIERYELPAEQQWMRDAAAKAEVDPHHWPSGPYLDALRAAEAEATCQGCGQRGKPSVCRHGKCICEDCYPDLCWGCQADVETEGPTW